MNNDKNHTTMADITAVNDNFITAAQRDLPRTTTATKKYKQQQQQQQQQQQ